MENGVDSLNVGAAAAVAPAQERTIRVETPQTPPEWALLERELCPSCERRRVDRPYVGEPAPLRARSLGSNLTVS